MNYAATPTMFRVFIDDGSVIALFVRDPGTLDAWTCDSYMHIGQHGSACTRHLSSVTRPATHEESRPLMRELRAIGYKIAVRRRISRADFHARIAACDTRRGMNAKLTA